MSGKTTESNHQYLGWNTLLEFCQRQRDGKGGKEQRFDIFTNFADGIKATESSPLFGRSQNGLSMESRPSGHHLDEAR